jgi:hypothetical protein
MYLLKSLAVLSTVTMAGAAMAGGAVDDSQPLACKATQSHDCLPGKACQTLDPKSSPFEGNKDYHFIIDFKNMSARSIYRESTLPITTANKTDDRLVVQGIDKSVAWSAVIKRSNGALTVTVADRDGAYILFGECAAKKATDKKAGS